MVHYNWRCGYPKFNELAGLDLLFYVNSKLNELLYVNKEVFSCSVLKRIRENNEYQFLHSLIDNFAARNECL